MTRLARMVIPGLARHVTQRGNRREAIFFENGDHEIYRDMLVEQLRSYASQVLRCGTNQDRRRVCRREEFVIVSNKSGQPESVSERRICNRISDLISITYLKQEIL